MIPDYNWGNILSELPVDADSAAIRAKVEAAVVEYQTRAAKPMRDLWKQLARQAESASVAKMCELIRRIGPPDPLLPDPGFIGALAPTPDWLLRLQHELSMLPEVAAAIADLYKPKERLYSRLLRSWPGRLTVSAEGPLTRFLHKILDPLFDDAIDSETLKKAIERERPRRQIFASAGLKAATE
jgi:hypothetical protein